MAALNEAYDLSLFEPQEEVLQPKLKVTETLAPVAGTIPGNVLFLAAMAIVAVALMIFCQVRISEVSAQVNAAKAELTVLENENRMLKNQLESSTSLRLIEEQVTRAYGMSEAEDYQVEYIALSTGDSIQIKRDNKTDILQKATTTVGSFLEYINLR